MTKAIIYARVSTTRQADEGISMDAQIEQCSRRAEQLGAKVVQVFRDDGASGRTVKGRPAFRAALAYCSTGNVNYFITWSTSRFARNAVDLWMQQDALKESGTRLECLNADIDDDTDAGLINKMFWGAMDQLQSRQIGRDTLRSMKRSAEDGFFTGGRVPFGYRQVPEGKRVRIQPHPDQAPVIQRMFDLCVNQGLGAQAIALRLNELGMLRSGQNWKKNTVTYALANEVYRGIKVFNRSNKKTGKEKPPEEWIKVASHEPLVSADIFERAQAMIEQRTPHEHGGTAKSTFVFSGLVKCGVCGEGLQIINGTGRGGTLYNYYGCVAHRKGLPRCLFRNVRADQFDDWLLSEILDKVITPDTMLQTIREIANGGEQWAKDRATLRADLVVQVRDVEGKRDRLLEVLEASGAAGDMEAVTDRLRERNRQLRGLQEQLAKLEAIVQPGAMPKIDPEVAVEVMREVVMGGDPKKKRAFMGAFVESAVITVDTVNLTYRADALVNIGNPTNVRSSKSWLLDLGSNQGPTD